MCNINETRYSHYNKAIDISAINQTGLAVHSPFRFIFIHVFLTYSTLSVSERERVSSTFFCHNMSLEGIVALDWKAQFAQQRSHYCVRDGLACDSLCESSVAMYFYFAVPI